MTKTELFALMGEMYEAYKRLKAEGTLTFNSMNDKLKLIPIFQEIYPMAKIDLGCDGCVKEYLNILASYYERECLSQLNTPEASASNETPEESPKKGKRPKKQA